jgi:hypothetical protein
LKTEKPLISGSRDSISYCGSSVPVTSIQIDDKRLIVRGRLLTVARLKDEWYDDIGDPALIIVALKRCRPTPDIFTFWQRLPDTVPVYSYHHEPDALSAIPLKSFQHWWDKQIKSDTRKKAKRAEKRGIQLKVVPLDEAFVRGVMGIFNETPVRRGKPCWHYGKDFATVKRELSMDLQRSKFIGAYDNGTLVGFVKLVIAQGRFANPGLILSKIKAREKYVNNALLAKTVELCSQDSTPYLTYTNWRRGTQAEFLMRHGFQKTLVPRYWIPLTTKGAVAIKLGLHRNIRAYIPEWLLDVLRNLRKAFYSKRHRNDGDEND